MKIILLGLIIISMSAHASPEKLEVWFISPTKTALLDKIISPYFSITAYSRIAFSEGADTCIPMGDGCFDPQYGYMEKKSKGFIKEDVVVPIHQATVYDAGEKSLINCEDGSLFNLYCANGSNSVAAASANDKLELWIDISASMRSVDDADASGSCKRKELLDALIKACPGVSYFGHNTSKKSLGDTSAVCVNYGTNDKKRLKEWVKESTAHRLIIITDIDEYESEMIDYFTGLGATIRGGDGSAMNALQMLNQAQALSLDCK